MNNRKQIIPNKLKEYRIKTGLTQIRVAKIFGFSTEERICHWEKGRSIPNLINLFRLSSLYGANPVELYPDLMKDTHVSIETKLREIVFSFEPPQT